METISSNRTFLFKRVIPVLWVGLMLFSIFTGAIAQGAARNHEFLLIPLLMLVIGVVLFRKLLWNLADEVRDGGNVLVVRRGQVEERVPLTNVMNVSMSQYTNPPRLTLRLRARGKFGDEISFIPTLPLLRNPFARNEVAEMLIARVDRLRSEHGQSR